MDLGFAPLSPADAVPLSPADSAVLSLAETAVLAAAGAVCAAATPISARDEAATWCPATAQPLAPAGGAFSAAMAARLTEWRRA